MSEPKLFNRALAIDFLTQEYNKAVAGIHAFFDRQDSPQEADAGMIAAAINETEAPIVQAEQSAVMAVNVDTGGGETKPTTGH